MASWSYCFQLLVCSSFVNCFSINGPQNVQNSENYQSLIPIHRNISETIPRITREVEGSGADESINEIAIKPIEGDLGLVMERMVNLHDDQIIPESHTRSLLMEEGSGEGSGDEPEAAAMSLSDLDPFKKEVDVKEIFDELAGNDENELATESKEEDDGNKQANELNVLGERHGPSYVDDVTLAPRTEAPPSETIAEESPSDINTEPVSETKTETPEIISEAPMSESEIVTESPVMETKTEVPVDETEAEATHVLDINTVPLVTNDTEDAETTTSTSTEEHATETDEVPAVTTYSEEVETTDEPISATEETPSEEADIATTPANETKDSNVDEITIDSTPSSSPTSIEEFPDYDTDSTTAEPEEMTEESSIDTEEPETSTDLPVIPTDEVEITTVEPDTTQDDVKLTTEETDLPVVTSEEPETSTDLTEVTSDEPSSSMSPILPGDVSVEVSSEGPENITSEGIIPQTPTTSTTVSGVLVDVADSNPAESASEIDPTTELQSTAYSTRVGSYGVIALIVISFVGLVGYIALRNRRRKREKEAESKVGSEDKGKEDKALLGLNDYRDSPEGGEVKNNEINPSLLKQNKIKTNLEKNSNFSSCPKNLNVNSNEKQITKDNNINSLKNSTVPDLAEVIIEQSPPKQNGVDKSTQNTEKCIVKTLVDEDSIPKRPVLIDRNSGLVDDFPLTSLV